MSNFEVETSHCSSRNWCTCNYERLITVVSSKLLVGPSLTMSDFQLLSQMMLKNTLSSDFFYNQKLLIFSISSISVVVNRINLMGAFYTWKTNMLSWYDIDKFVMYYSKNMLNNRLDWTKRITKIFCYRHAGVKKSWCDWPWRKQNDVLFKDIFFINIL